MKKNLSTEDSKDIEKINEHIKNIKAKINSLKSEDFQNIFMKIVEDRDLLFRVRDIVEIPKKEPIYKETTIPLSNIGVDMLSKLNITKIYSHQAQTYDAVNKGENVLLVTPTASGKTLSFNLPIVENLLKNPKDKALYIYPTKALARDQEQKLIKLGIDVGVYDGDTPKKERMRIKEKAQVIITNPDMLHRAILPHHSRWDYVFQNLKYIVIDELHLYKGIFGSHVSFVFKRLKRISYYNNSEPIYVACSATIKNPKEFAEKLLDTKFTLIDQNGAPSGKKYFVFWNPPIIEPISGTRRSVIEDGGIPIRMLTELGIPNISFLKSRKGTEEILLNVKNHLKKEYINNIESYRGGYLSEERREIENKMFSGELTSIISTNALEVGIDVGKIDACCIIGYPGTISSTFQQSGRAGRSNKESLVFLVASSNPLDQYFMTSPNLLFEAPMETPVISIENKHISKKQLDCILYEAPWVESVDGRIFGSHMHPHLEELLNKNKAILKNNYIFRTSTDYPAAVVNIRSSSENQWRILEINTNKRIGYTEDARIIREFHPMAIYIHRGLNYQVREINYEDKSIYVEEFIPNYKARPLIDKDIVINKVIKKQLKNDIELYFGEITVTETITNVELLFKDGTKKLLPVSMPTHTFNTESFWWVIPENISIYFHLHNIKMDGAIHSLEHVAIALLPIFTMCDRWDIGGFSTPFHLDYRKPTIFIYDGCEGGIGYSELAYDYFIPLLEKSLITVENCKCKKGCPACIYSPKCGNGNKPLHKESSIILTKKLLKKT